MTATEIRERVHAAIGEPRHPATLTDRVARRISEAGPRPAFGGYRLAAALIAGLIVAALLLSRFLSEPLIGYQPGPAFKSNQVVGTVDPNAKVPAEDLAAADLAGQASELVTPLNLTAVSHGRTIKIIGAYADTARVVLFFRGESPGFSVSPQVSDRTGGLNYGAGGSSGYPGDWVVILMGAAHPDARGIAHLDVAVAAYETAPDQPGLQGTWNFSFDVKVHGPNALTLSPALSSIGTWKVKVEAMEATPSVVRFQVLIDAPPEQVDSLVVALLDSSGHEVQKSSGYTLLTNKMFFFIVIGSPKTRLNVIWMRPPPGAYELRISGHGFEYSGALTIPYAAS